jgi:hypothetical protein
MYFHIWAPVEARDPCYWDDYCISGSKMNSVLYGKMAAYWSFNTEERSHNGHLAVQRMIIS